MAEAGAFHEVSHPCERADEGSLGQHLGSLSFSTVGQSRTAGKLPAQTPALLQMGQGKGFRGNHGEGQEQHDLQDNRQNQDAVS